MTIEPFRLTALALLPGLATCTAGSSADAFDDLPVHEAVTELRIGSVDDPEYALTYFRDIEVGRDGSIYALLRSDQEVRVFAPDGAAEGIIGGRGDGPGELQNAVEMGWVRDTLWVLDARGYRFNQYDVSGAFLGSFSVPFEFGERGEAGPPRARGLLADGTLHGAVPAWSHMIAEGSLTHAAPVLMRRDGTVLQELPRVPFGRNMWAISDPDDPRAGAMYRDQPFADGPLWSFVPRERAMMVLEREAPETEERSAFHLTKLSFDGDTLWSRDYPFTPEATPLEVADSVLEELSATMEERGILGVTRATARQWADRTLYRPAFQPPVTEMVIARDGSTWLSLGSNGVGGDDWIILDRDGEPVARTTLPSGLDVLLVVPPLVYAREQDELDVPYLVRVRIEGIARRMTA